VKADVMAFCREYPAAASLAYKIRDTPSKPSNPMNAPTSSSMQAMAWINGNPL
jgi:hypothetical protein